MIGFLKKVEVCEDGDLYLTIQKIVFILLKI